MLDHKHIIRLYSAFVQLPNIVLVMEYASGGEVRSYVEEKGMLDEVEARQYVH